MIDFTAEIRLPAPLEELVVRWAFNGTVRMRTWKKIAAQLRQGLDLDQSLRIMRDRAADKKSPLARVFGSMLDHLSTGHDLGESLIGYASPEEIMLISGGQLSGRLPEGLMIAANLIAVRRKIVSSVLGALAYPALLLGAVCVLLIVVSVVVVPQLASIIDPSKWSGAAGVLYAVASFVTSPSGIVAFAFLGVICLLILGTLPLWTGTLRLQFDRIPPWSIYRLTVGAVWMFSLSTLMRSGLQIAHICNDMLNAQTLTPWLRERIEAVLKEFEQGKNLGHALYDTGLRWPDPELVDDLRIYADLPGFYGHLHELAEEWIEEGIVHVQKQTRIINILCMFLIIAIACGIVLSIGSLQQQLSNSMGGL